MKHKFIRSNRSRLFYRIPYFVKKGFKPQVGARAYVNSQGYLVPCKKGKLRGIALNAVYETPAMSTFDGKCLAFVSFGFGLK